MIHRVKVIAYTARRRFNPSGGRLLLSHLHARRPDEAFPDPV